jgi:hypothetical protein
MVMNAYLELGIYVITSSRHNAFFKIDFSVSENLYLFKEERRIHDKDVHK